MKIGRVKMLKTVINFPSLQMFDVCNYRNDPKFSDTQALANSADPDQTAPRGAV